MADLTRGTHKLGQAGTMGYNSVLPSTFFAVLLSGTMQGALLLLLVVRSLTFVTIMIVWSLSPALAQAPQSPSPTNQLQTGANCDTYAQPPGSGSISIDEYRKQYAICADRWLSNTNDPDQSYCADLSKSWREEYKHIESWCGGHGSSACYERISNCRDKISEVTRPNSRSQNGGANQGYSQAFQQLQGESPACATTLLSRDSDWLKDQVEKAQEKLDDMADKIDQANEKMVRSQSEHSKSLYDLERETVGNRKNLERSAAEEEEKLQDFLQMARERNQGQMLELGRQILALTNAIASLEKDMPVQADLEYRTEVAKIRSDCLARGREVAGKLAQVDRKSTKSLFQLLMTNNERNAEKRFKKAKNHEIALCLKDNKANIEILEIKKQAALEKIRKEIINQKAQKALLNVQLQQAVQNNDARNKNKVVQSFRSYQEKMSDSEEVQRTYIQRMMQLSSEQQQQQALLNSQLQSYQQQRSTAELLLSTTPLPSGKGNTDGAFDKFEKALGGLAATDAVFLGSEICCDDYKIKPGLKGVDRNICVPIGGRDRGEDLRDANQ